MDHRKGSVVLSMLMIAVLALSACGPAATTEPAADTAVPAAPEPTQAAAADTAVPAAPEPTKAPEGPPQGGTIVLMGHQEVSGLSPDNQGPDVEHVMVFNIHNALVELSPSKTRARPGRVLRGLGRQPDLHLQAASGRLVP